MEGSFDPAGSTPSSICLARLFAIESDRVVFPGRIFIVAPQNAASVMGTVL
jgi:hypothetical protein